MTENEFNKIIDLHKHLKDIEDKEKDIKTEMDFPNFILFDSVAEGIKHYDAEINGNGVLVFNRITDKIFYENQDRIKKVIMDILQEGLDKVVLEKNDLKLKFKNIKVEGYGEEKSHNEN